jgi:DNA (cytosine-5)-methyltransferase 1
MDLYQLNIKELCGKCKKMGLKGYKKKTKEELVLLITNFNKIIIESDSESDSESEPQISTLKYIDLFCGIGGFHQALNRLGAKCVLACDIDKDCREVYHDNYGITPVDNVKNIDEKTMDDFDILCGGFPCQAFSNGGKKKCFEDERGLLFDEIIRIARVKQPKFMFLENVKHILKVSNGEVIEYIKNKIASAGYHLQLFNISPHNYGIPQQRERIYFVCIRNDIYNNKEIVLPTYTGKIEFEKFLDRKECIESKHFVKGDVLNVLESWDEMIKQFDTNEKISPTIMMNDAFKTYTPEEFENFPEWKKEYITKNKPLIEKYKTQFKEWYEKHYELLQKREIYGKLEWQTGLIKKDDSIFNHFIQIRQSGIRVKKSHYFPTLVAISQIPIYGKEKRYITPRECARLQSFPESFKLSKDDKKSYKQFGNSVNVDNVFTVISSTLKHYNI